MAVSAGSRLAPPVFVADEVQHRRLIAQWEREAHQGHLANVGSVTLAANTASTRVVDFRVGPNSFIGLVATTANAAAEVGPALVASSLYISSRSAEAFTITHANNAQTDRTFAYCVLG